MLSSFVLFSSWLSFSCNVFGIVCDLLSLIHILCTCVRFTATFFFWIEGAALLFWTLWYSTTTWHWCHSFQLFSLPKSFHFFSLLPSLNREAINSGSEVGHRFNFHSFLLFSVFVSLFQSNIFCWVFWRFLHSLTFSLVCSFFFLTLSASLSATLSGLLCHSDDLLLSSVKQLLLYYMYGLAPWKQVTCMKVICF